MKNVAYKITESNNLLFYRLRGAGFLIHKEDKLYCFEQISFVYHLRNDVDRGMRQQAALSDIRTVQKLWSLPKRWAASLRNWLRSSL